MLPLYGTCAREFSRTCAGGERTLSRYFELVSLGLLCIQQTAFLADVFGKCTSVKGIAVLQGTVLARQDIMANDTADVTMVFLLERPLWPWLPHRPWPWLPHWLWLPWQYRPLLIDAIDFAQTTHRHQSTTHRWPFVVNARCILQQPIDPARLVTKNLRKIFTAMLTEIYKEIMSCRPWRRQFACLTGILDELLVVQVLPFVPRAMNSFVAACIISGPTENAPPSSTIPFPQG